MIIEPSAFIFFGRSGCGKGTQAKLLIKFLTEKDPERNVLYVETGRLLRDFGAKQRGFAAKKTKELIDTGHLLPEFVPICVWGEYLLEHVKKGNEHFVFDGVSRRIPEAPILHSALDFFDKNIRHVLLINTSKEWSIERLLSRGRVDDDRDEISRRLAWFDENVRPAIRFFENNPSYQFHEINGEQSIEAVQQEVLRNTGLVG